jgi:hypothetical protein
MAWLFTFLSPRKVREQLLREAKPKYVLRAAIVHAVILTIRARSSSDQPRPPIAGGEPPS